MGYMKERNPQVSSDVTGEWWEKLFGFDAEQAAITVKSGPHFLAEYVMRGDTGRARHEAQRIALARDALPTRAEMGAISYRERLARALQAPEQQQDGELAR